VGVVFDILMLQDENRPRPLVRSFQRCISGPPAATRMAERPLCLFGPATAQMAGSGLCIKVHLSQTLRLPQIM
jgi:hypothetical protein